MDILHHLILGFQLETFNNMNDEDNEQNLVHNNPNEDNEQNLVDNNITIKKKINLIVFITQTFLLYIVCVIAIINLSLGVNCKPLWISLLSFGIGSLLPNPEIKNNETNDNSQISNNHRFSKLKKTRNLIVFLVQIVLLYVVIITSIINLIYGSTCKPIWIWLLSSSLGYIMPSPKLKYNSV